MQLVRTLPECETGDGTAKGESGASPTILELFCKRLQADLVSALVARQGVQSTVKGGHSPMPDSGLDLVSMTVEGHKQSAVACACAVAYVNLPLLV